jgi:ethanolamine ammonia-lyase small subunit
MLAFQLAHARARDAVGTPLDASRLAAALDGPVLKTQSQAHDLATYLKSPQLGRRLDPSGPPLTRGDYDLAVVIADGLSAAAVHAHAVDVQKALIMRLPGWRLAPTVVVRFGRVAIGDEIGQALGARAVVVLIGERPGLSAADSLSAYLTHAPRVGRADSERNCVSGIRGEGGLDPTEAAQRLSWLLLEARRMGFSGVALKDRHRAADGGLAPAPKELG